MKIALAQLNYTIGDFAGNTAKIIKAIEQARDNDAGLIVFSELAVCGYPPDDLLDYPHFIQHCKDALDEIAKATTGITAVVGCPVVNTHAKGRRLYNAACILSNGELVDSIFKTLLPTYDVFSEARYFQSNENFRTVNINGINTAITICEDLWDEMDFFSYTQDPLKNLSAFNPQLILNISASPFNADKEKTRYEILRNQAVNFKLPLVYVNQVGAHTDLIFDGNSLFINANGSIAKQLKSFEEELAYVDFNDKQKNLYLKKRNALNKLHKALVFGLRDYFSKMGFTKAVLGSSGGIDSAVVQALLSEAIGGENVTAILMPSQFSSEGSVNDAIMLSQNLNNPHYILPIKNIFECFDAALEPLFKDSPFNVAEENIQARSRAVLLMAYSNKFGAILVNTSNKSEMSVGYTTLYGDMCGSISVIGDVYKTDVFALADRINIKEILIPTTILRKAPSAELRPDQKDSDSLPPYEILDAILKAYIEEQLSVNEIVASGFERETVERSIKMVNNNEYKRFQAPPILRVSSKAYGRGRVIPLVAKFKN